MVDNATQFLLSLRDIAELIIKKNDIHEGHWTTTVGIQIGMGSFGPTLDQQFPGAAVTVGNVGIQKVDPANTAAINHPLTVDAAIVNPAQAEKPSGKKRSK